VGKINHCALLERFAVIDDNRHAFVVVEARDFDFGSHRQAAVGCGHRSFFENLTACGLVAAEPWPVPVGLALQGLGVMSLFLLMEPDGFARILAMHRCR